MSINPRLVRVPGNLLITGEYAVLEEGGPGLACAVSPRISITAEPAENLTIYGASGTASFMWPSSDSGLLLEAVVRTAEEASGRLPAVKISIDTSVFFDAERGKLGYGSSAAAAAGLLFMLLAWSGYEPFKDLEKTGSIDAVLKKPWMNDFAQLAVMAHRRAQQGRGSGYDVSASFWGGAGIISGGRECSWEACRAEWLNELFVVYGPASVNTRNAISAYTAWREENREKAAAYMALNSRITERIAGVDSAVGAAGILNRAGRVSAWLGRQIGVHADGLDSVFKDVRQRGGGGKLLGAGGEIGVVFCPEKQYFSMVNKCLPLQIEAKGLTWSQ